jgi:AraC family transcriptional regulator of arabinose operon
MSAVFSPSPRIERLLTLPALIPELYDIRLLRARDRLERALEESLTLEEVAQGVHLSPSSLSHRFREEFGVSPMRYRETQRLRRARFLLLTTDLPVKAIAGEVGYTNPFHFSRRFRIHFGHSPTACRSNPDWAAKGS